MFMTSPEVDPSDTPTYFDLYSGGLIIGQAAYEAAIEAMERGGYPADIRHLPEIVDNDEILPSYTRGWRDKYKDWTREDFINNGRWLLKITGNLTSPRISRLSRLGLHANTSTIAARFGGLPAYHKAIGQNEVSAYGAFTDWDIVDVVTHLYAMGQEENKRPSLKMISRRIASGKEEPGAFVIDRIVPPLIAIELSGYVMPRNWQKRQYQEWGYLFYLANKRLPNKSDLDVLSPKYLAPSHGGTALTFEGQFTDFKASIIRMVRDRRKIQLQEIAQEFRKSPEKVLLENYESNEELIRRVGRYKIIKQLLTKSSLSTNIQLSRYDVIGEEFISYLQRQDKRIEDWMVEGAARRVMCYPELFPDGDFYSQLEVPSSGTSFLARKSKLNLDELKKLLRPKRIQNTELNDIELNIMEMIMSGHTIPEISRAVLNVSNDKRLNKDYIYPLRKSLKARNNAHLVRLALEKTLIDINRRPNGSTLTLKQKEILELISFGASQKIIASILGIAPITVSSHVRKIKRRLGAVNEAQAVSEGFITGNLYLPHEGSYIAKALLD